VIIAGINDLEVTAVVIVVNVIEDIVNMLLIIPNPLMVEVLYFDADTSFLLSFVNAHEFFLISYELLSIILFVF